MIDVTTIFIFFGVPSSLVLLGYGAVLIHERRAPSIGVPIDQDPGRSRESPRLVKRPVMSADRIRAVFEALESMDADEQQKPAQARPHAKVD